ncbi:MAG: cobalamin B12-binding domain-containing protein, partial [Acidobacteriota bacterium]
LDDDELRRMLTEEQAMTYATSPPLPGPQTVTSVSVTELDDPEAIVAMCLEAVTRLDSQMLNTTLRRASVSFGRLQLLQGIVVPLMARIGQGWRAGELRPFHEHMATVVMRTFLTQLPGAYRSSPSAPALIVATPAGQYHDLGALLVAATASADDWKIVLLGASLPAEEIAGAFLQANARAIALSITFPADDPHLGDELLRLRDLIGNHVPLLVGGRASHGYTPYLESIKAHQVNDLATFETLLQTLRNSSTESLRE